MKTEDIDKKIGMPDVDKEWAKFEREVINQEAKPKRRAIVAWVCGVGIAASVALFLMLHVGNLSNEKTPVIAQQTVKQTAEVGNLHDNTMRLRGTNSKGEDNMESPLDSKNDSILTVIDGEPILLAVNQLTTEEEIERFLHVAIDNIMVYKDENNKLPYIKKYGEMARNGVVVIKTKSDIKDFPSLQGHISGLDIPQQQIRKDSFIVVVNGQIQPDLKKWFQRDLHQHFYHLQQMIDKISILSVQATKAIYGVENRQAVEIITIPDTLCDAYVRQHPELMQTRKRVEGYVVDKETNKPLADAWIHLWDPASAATVSTGYYIFELQRLICERAGVATDSTGHFILWLPQTDVTLRASCTGYKTVANIQISDSVLTIRMNSAVLIKEVKVLKKKDKNLIPLKESKFNPDEFKKYENAVLREDSLKGRID